MGNGAERSPTNPPPTPQAAGSDDLRALHRYFAGLRDQFAIYENLGLPVPERDGKEGEKDAPIPIRKLFVAPTCTDAHFRPEAFDAALRDGKNPAVPLLPRLAPAKSRTVLLADPGMGKSTLIQWLISILADEAVPLDEKELRGAIPLPFILRDLVGHLPQEVKGWNWDALVAVFRQWRHRGKGAPLAAQLTADEAFFRSILASPDAFFLIDGLDEIGDPQRRLAIRDAIWEGFEKYPNTRWLVTSRIVGYEQAEVSRERRVVGSGSKEAGPTMEDEVRKSGSLGWTSRRFTEGSQELQELVVIRATLLHLADIDLGRHLPDSLIVPWKFEGKEDLLALAAMRMQEIRVAQAKDKKGGDEVKDARGEILVTRAQLEEWLGPRFGGAGDAEARAELLHRFLDHIANRSGLLLPRGEGVFGFAHLSFQEYYAACALEKEFRRILNEKAQPSLSLNSCMSVSDLKPLAGLASLRILHLNGCMAVSDEAVAALQASLPKLDIVR